MISLRLFQIYSPCLWPFRGSLFLNRFYAKARSQSPNPFALPLSIGRVLPCDFTTSGLFRLVRAIQQRPLTQRNCSRAVISVLGRGQGIARVCTEELLRLKFPRQRRGF